MTDTCKYKGKRENGETVIGSCHEGRSWFKYTGGYELCPVCSRPVVNKVKRNPNIASRERETKGETIGKDNK